MKLCDLWPHWNSGMTGKISLYAMSCFISHLSYLRNWSTAALHLPARLNLISNGVRYFYLVGGEETHCNWPHGPHGLSMERGLLSQNTGSCS